MRCGAVKRLKVVTVVDNNVWRESLNSSWGLSLHLLTENNRLLMDTSGDYHSFKWNAERLGLRLPSIDGILISHWHRDHCGALKPVLQDIGHPVPVYVPSRYLFMELNRGGWRETYHR